MLHQRNQGLDCNINLQEKRQKPLIWGGFFMCVVNIGVDMLTLKGVLI